MQKVVDSVSETYGTILMVTDSYSAHLFRWKCVLFPLVKLTIVLVQPKIDMMVLYFLTILTSSNLHLSVVRLENGKREREQTQEVS